MTALVGVYIPAYNAAQFIAKAVQSVLNQSFKDFELIIVDDASTDNTPEIIAPYLNHPQVSYIRNEQNLGMAGNWNKGIQSLSNKYIAKLDADDYYDPDFLAHTVPVAENFPEVGLVYGGLDWIVEEGQKVTRMLPYSESWIVDGKLFCNNMFRQYTIYGPTILVRRACYQKLGVFIPQMRIHCDWEMWTRIASHYKVAYVNEKLATVVRHADNCTTQSQSDTRTPDDLALWLNLLDTGNLPYSLDKPSRFLLEAAMIKMVRKLLYRSLTMGSNETTIACAQFLGQRPMVPAFEKMRYWLISQFIRKQSKLAVELTRGRRYTEQWWALEKRLKIKLPARNPMDALAI